MKSRPLLMKHHNVWAILQQHKKETRRLNNRFKMEAGDWFWIREPSAIHNWERKYKADYTMRPEIKCIKWDNPRYMPKAAARLMLNLSEVRQERLGDITEAGAIAEGVGAFRTEEMINKYLWPVFDRNGPKSNDCIAGAKYSFIRLWNSIGKNDWARDQDKTVWVFRWETFEVIK